MNRQESHAQQAQLSLFLATCILFGISTNQSKYAWNRKKKLNIPMSYNQIVDDNSNHLQTLWQCEPRHHHEIESLEKRIDGVTEPRPFPKKIQENHIWLVVGPPLWKIWTSVGMISNPIYGKIKNVPNHQPDIELPRNSVLPPTFHLAKSHGPGARLTIIFRHNVGGFILHLRCNRGQFNLAVEHHLSQRFNKKWGYTQKSS